MTAILTNCEPGIMCLILMMNKPVLMSVPLVSWPALAIERIPGPVWRSLLMRVVRQNLNKRQQQDGCLQVLISELGTVDGLLRRRY